MRLKPSGERRSETGESLAPDRTRGQAGSRLAEKGRRPVAVELAIGGLWSTVEPVVESAGLASEARLEAAARRASGRPVIKPGQDSGAAQRRSFRHREGWGGSQAAVESRQRGSEDRGEGMGGRQGRAGRRSGPGRQRVS
jgi:hypothetical protein